MTQNTDEPAKSEFLVWEEEIINGIKVFVDNNFSLTPKKVDGLELKNESQKVWKTNRRVGPDLHLDWSCRFSEQVVGQKGHNYPTRTPRLFF